MVVLFETVWSPLRRVRPPPFFFFFFFAERVAVPCGDEGHVKVEHGVVWPAVPAHFHGAWMSVPPKASCSVVCYFCGPCCFSRL